MKYLKYTWTVLRHKWYVFLECCKLGIPLQGVIHDWSKFLPAEFFPYVNYFNGGYERGKHPPEVQLAFNFAWLHHQHWNKHHWQSYVLHFDNAECPKWYVQAHNPQEGPWNLSVYDGENKVEHIAEFSDQRVSTEDRANWLDRADRDLGDYLDHDVSLHYAEHVAREMSRVPSALPIPDKFRREMLADWRGASRAYTGGDNTRAWYLKNADGMILHPETRDWIERQLDIHEGDGYIDWLL